MAAALVPLAALAFIFSYSDHLRRADAEQSRFIDSARLIGQSSAKILARTEGYAAALAAHPETDFESCAALFDALRQELRQAVELRVTAGDRLLCERSIERTRISVLGRDIPASDLPAAIPVSRSNKASGLTVEIGLLPQALLTAPIAATISSHFSFALVNSEGDILAAHADSPGESEGFRILLTELDLDALPLQSRLKTDHGWLIASVALSGTDFRIITGVLPSRTALEPWLSVAKALLLPISLLAVVFVVLRFGTQRFLLRYIRHIYATFRRYGSGDLDARVGKLDRAPAEINILGMTFDMMADRIAYRTRDLEDSLNEQQRLTRELHHRIKNTLQMISSLLGMQRRDAKEPCEQAALRVALERVLGISAAYRVSYASNEETDVALSALVNEVVEALREPAHLPRSTVKISSDEKAQATIVLDKAIPLAFILAELLPPRFNNLSPGETIHVDVKGGPVAVLEISGVSKVDKNGGLSGSETPLTARLMDGYLGQLSATCETVGSVTRIEIPLETGK